jgi:hypothetical protein
LLVESRTTGGRLVRVLLDYAAKQVEARLLIPCSSRLIVLAVVSQVDVGFRVVQLYDGVQVELLVRPVLPLASHFANAVKMP